MLLAGPPHRQSVWTGPGLSGDWLMFGRHQPGTSSKNDQRTRTPSLHSTPPTCAAAFWHRLLWVFETNINLLNSDRDRERERERYLQTNIFCPPGWGSWPGSVSLTDSTQTVPSIPSVLLRHWTPWSLLPSPPGTGGCWPGLSPAPSTNTKQASIVSWNS